MPPDPHCALLLKKPDPVVSHGLKRPHRCPRASHRTPSAPSAAPWCFRLCPPGPPAQPQHISGEVPPDTQLLSDISRSGLIRFLSFPYLDTQLQATHPSYPQALYLPPVFPGPHPHPMTFGPAALWPQTPGPCTQIAGVSRHPMPYLSPLPRPQVAQPDSRPPEWPSSFQSQVPSLGLYPHPTHFLSSSRPLTRKGLGVFCHHPALCFPSLEPSLSSPVHPPLDPGVQAPSPSSSRPRSLGPQPLLLQTQESGPPADYISRNAQASPPLDL